MGAISDEARDPDLYRMGMSDGAAGPDGVVDAAAFEVVGVPTSSSSSKPHTVHP